MAATLKDIAQHMNLSVATVSRALNNKGRISKETTQRIMQVAEEMGYKPNESARALKTNRSSTIGVIIPDSKNIFYSKMLKSIDQVLLNKGYSIIFCDSDEKIEREQEYFELLKSKSVSGMIIVTAGKTDIYNEEKSLSNIVFVDNIPSISRPFSFVAINNVKAAYELTQLVIDYGHKDICMICADLSETTGYDRLQGFKECLIDNKLTFSNKCIIKGTFQYQTGYSAGDQILAMKKKPTAIFAQNNMQAYGVIKRLREADVRIPEDISVVCFDAIDETGLMSPKLTCVMQPVEEIGRQAVMGILDGIKNENQAMKQIELDYEIFIGNSLVRI